MSKEDFNVADRPHATADGKVITAGKKILEAVFDTPEEDHADFIAVSGQDVSEARFVNYADALEAYEARDDIETLADRRARENGEDFDAGAFMRAPAGDTAPTSGSVNGTAPASA